MGSWRWRGDGADSALRFRRDSPVPPPECAVRRLADSQWHCPDSDRPLDWLTVGPIARETCIGSGDNSKGHDTVLRMTTTTRRLHRVERAPRGKTPRSTANAIVTCILSWYYRRAVFEKETRVIRTLKRPRDQVDSREGRSLVYELPTHCLRRISLAVRPGTSLSLALPDSIPRVPGVASRIPPQFLRRNAALRSRIHSICEPRDSVGSLDVTRIITLHIEQTFPFWGRFSLPGHSSLNPPVGAWKDACMEQAWKPAWE